MQFQKAERKKSKLRLALTGPSGSGKTYGALLVAKGLGGRIAVIDTEKGSASLYSHLVDFDVLDLEAPYTPERYRQAVRLAVENGYDVVIIDSITHEWSGAGGCLELNDEIAKAKFKGNTWSAWSETKARHRALIDDLLASPTHIIVTMRSKTETAQAEINGRKQVQKLGMKAEQNDGIEYEFTTVLDLIHDGNFAQPSKDRTGLFPPNGNPFKLSAEIGKQLVEWLESGVDLTFKRAEVHRDKMLQKITTAETLELLGEMSKYVTDKFKDYPILLTELEQAILARKASLDNQGGE
ncbi:ATP-binding protein [Avibacterium paragallinarum]|uniref:AAA+ ATPase domain-containing protein n=2 Tax=Avibacterium paragallinarum TaxID=728 RepID=A0A0F5EV01_AVIPA|nr:ATP-binding protein [Avibacterium paragallinarum]AZI13593.1 ATP-binding protein [Avibacterium paragallinarum]KAA6207917.1 ATP-binding protein [Avibacterium paragallinarum]QIR12092.1 ATP-binding protein [Avibacterium paragallinarum]QJE09088.1 ATP-binding protein [Avibacterium paragallinarum]QJE11284.1 ATP-binding protein [Avibacterium paragallinarum]